MADTIRLIDANRLLSALPKTDPHKDVLVSYNGCIALFAVMIGEQPTVEVSVNHKEKKQNPCEHCSDYQCYTCPHSY